MKRSKQAEKPGRRGLNWALIIQNLGIATAVWLGGVFLGVVLASPFVLVFYVPAGLVAVLAYYRSEQATRFQMISEAAFTGAGFLIIAQLLGPLLGILLGGQTAGQ